MSRDHLHRLFLIINILFKESCVSLLLAVDSAQLPLSSSDLQTDASLYSGLIFSHVFLALKGLKHY